MRHVKINKCSLPGKSYTMLGAPDSAAALGAIPCAISWLFRGISEQRHRCGTRFSVRVSAVELCTNTNQIRDLLTAYQNGEFFQIVHICIPANKALNILAHFSLNRVRQRLKTSYDPGILNINNNKSLRTSSPVTV